MGHRVVLHTDTDTEGGRQSHTDGQVESLGDVLDVGWESVITDTELNGAGLTDKDVTGVQVLWHDVLQELLGDLIGRLGVNFRVRVAGCGALLVVEGQLVGLDGWLQPVQDVDEVDTADHVFFFGL